MTPTCAYCSNPVDLTRAGGHYRKVQGWARNRTKGGTHGLALLEELHEYMHSYCLDLYQAGIRPEQETLFGSR